MWFVITEMFMILAVLTTVKEKDAAEKKHRYFRIKSQILHLYRLALLHYLYILEPLKCLQYSTLVCCWLT